MNADELITRYTHEVARHLPRRSRADIRLELQSLLTETLERQAAKAGQEPDTAMAAALLQEFGSPESVAAGYLGERYLIGPALFPTFKTVATIVLAVIGGIFLAGFFILTLLLDRAVTPDFVFGMIQSLFSAAWAAFGSVVIIFAMLERLPHSKGASDESWNPRRLPPVDAKKDYSPVGLVLGIIFPLLAIIAFNFYPQWLVAIEDAPAGWRLVPILDPAFLVHVPWMTATWLLEIGLRLIVLQQRRWSPLTRWAEYAISLFSLFVLWRIFQSSPLTINGGIDIAVRMALGIALVVGAVAAVIKPFQLLFARPEENPSEEVIQPRSA